MQSGPFAYGLRYVDLRMARAMLNDPESMARRAHTRSTLDFEPRDDPPKELTPESDIRKIQPAKAPLLRKQWRRPLPGCSHPERASCPRRNPVRRFHPLHGAEGLCRFFLAVRPVVLVGEDGNGKPGFCRLSAWRILGEPRMELSDRRECHTVHRSPV